MSYQEELRALALLRSQRPQGALECINSLVEPKSFVELEAFFAARTLRARDCAQDMRWWIAARCLYTPMSTTF